jgi:hypothetical protein
MENLFTVIVLTAVSVLLFSFYYGFKGLYKTYQNQQSKKRIKQKTYENEKEFVRNHLRVLLGKLKTGELRWILVSSRLYPEDKLEITVNPQGRNLLVKTRHRELNEADIKMMKEMGIIASTYREEVNFLSMPINTKILTDIIYFCLEKIGRQENARNIKIITSGGSFQ